MSETKFDPAKPCRTRDGRAVRIYATDGTGFCPIHGRVEGLAYVWQASGKHFQNDDPLDLVNIPQKIDLWVNVERSLGVPFIRSVCHSKAEIEMMRQPATIACVHVVCEEGEGL